MLIPEDDALFTVAKVLFAVLGFGLEHRGFLGWVERKQSAVMQDRIGANRASIFGITIIGLFHPIADAIKMLTKEDFVAKGAHKPLHGLAPMISLGCGMFCLAALPFRRRDRVRRARLGPPADRLADGRAACAGRFRPSACMAS